MIVHDQITDPSLPGVARFHLVPGAELRCKADDRWEVTLEGRSLCRVHIDIGRARIEPSTHAQNFGAHTSTVCLAVDLKQGQAVTDWSWGT